MFKGKVYVYSNNNGKEEEFEREFDNPKEFHDFQRSYNKLHHQGFLGLKDWNGISDYFNDIIDRRFGLNDYSNDYYNIEDEKQYLPEGINMNEYEEELNKIDYAKAHKEEEIKSLKSTLKKLNEYSKRFEEEGRDDMVKKVEADIEKTEEKLNKLEKDNKNSKKSK